MIGFFKILQLSVGFIPLLRFVIKWLLLAIIVGILAGSASAFFLVSLDWVTDWRESHRWIIWLLPIGGFIVGAAYHYFGQEVVKGKQSTH